MAMTKTAKPPLKARLQAYQKRIQTPRPAVSGYLTRVVGLTFEAVGCRAPIGSLCAVEAANGDITAEVVGFSGEVIYLMPTEDAHGVLPGARVLPLQQIGRAHV